jgi:hypothetical protein
MEKKKRGPKGPSIWTEKKIGSLAQKLNVWRRSHTNFLLAKFCDENDVYPELLSRLANKNRKFRQALKAAKAHQEAVLSEGGINGEFNPAVTIFLLKNVAGYRDKQEVDHTTKGKELPTPILHGVPANNRDQEN